MRTLVSGIQREILEPARKEIRDATQLIDKARTSRETAVDAASALVKQHRAELESLLGRARAHLKAQDVSVDDGATATLQSTAGVAVGGQRSDADADKIQILLRERGFPGDPLACARAQLAAAERLVGETILNTTKPKDAWWPANENAGRAAVIFGLLLGIAGVQLFGGFGGFVVGALIAYVPMRLYIFNVQQQIRLRLQDDFRAASRATNMADVLLDDYLRGNEAHGQSEVGAAEQKSASSLATLEAKMYPLIDEVTLSIASLVAESGFAGADWNAPAWNHWAPSSAPAFAVRIGTLSAEAEDLRKTFPWMNWQFLIPALVPFPDGRCTLLKASGPAKDGAARAVQSVLGHLLATVPPGKLRFTFIDPVSLGNNVAAFMPLADHEESLVTSRAWSEPQHIEQRLLDLTEHMETVIQKYLRSDFKTIRDYNDAAKEVPEPYRFLVVFDFPVNFTDTAARRLVSIARNGARCGVYALIVCDTAKPLPYGFTLAELEQSAVVLASTAADSTGSWRWLDADMLQWQLQLDAPPPKATLDRIIATIGGQTKDAMRVEVPYDKLLALAGLDESTWWAAKTNKSVQVPLGPTGARNLQLLTLGEGMGHHALIVGRPGSGKSNLMHVIITTIALTYSPDEMRLYLIDFKKGVEFKCYADHKLPHAEAIAVESEREFGLSVVERLDLELTKRGELFRAVGAASITEYREKTGGQLPRILLLVDEFQEFFTQDDHIARQTTLVLDRLVRQGRAFGIHIILCSQTLAGSFNLAKSTLDQMAIRIAMQCSDADSRLVLSADNPAARLLSRPGEAIYNSATGLVEGNNLFQVARLSDADHEAKLTLVGRIARHSGKPIPMPIVFEGNELSRLTDCRTLGALINADDWPTKKGVDLVLGEPIAIRDPIVARIRRQSSSNLLVLSRDEAEGVGMCVASILSILAQQRPGMARVVIADFTLAESEWAERAEQIAIAFPHDVKVLSRQVEVAESVKEISDEAKRRGGAPAEASNIYLVLQGLQRMKILRADDGSFGYKDDPATPTEHLATILRDGPEVGIHVIAWCDTYSSSCRVADRRMMREFGLRAGGAMSADDSQSFFDDAAASRIDKPHRIIFSEEERPGQFDKFRPYSLPPREWIELAGSRLRTRLNPQG